MATVRDTDLPDLLISLGYQVKRIGRYYTTQEMDSIRIKDRRTWFRYSEGIGGDAITFLQRFYNKSFPEAVEYLLTWHGRARDSPPVSTPRQTKEKEEKVPFTLPPANVDHRRVFAYLEHEGQIVKFEVTNKSLTTGVSITKTGPKEIMAGQPVRYTFSGIANSSNVRLDNFYWRDTLPAEVRLDTVVTGTYNFPGTYKITYRVNGGEYRTLADNLSTSKNYTLAASATALGLASNERVTEVMFVFGQAPAGFAQVEKPYLHCTAVANLASTSFVNVADVGGVYNGQWVQAVSRWVTTVYGKPAIPTLPRTGY